MLTFAARRSDASDTAVRALVHSHLGHDGICPALLSVAQHAFPRAVAALMNTAGEWCSLPCGGDVFRLLPAGYHDNAQGEVDDERDPGDVPREASRSLTLWEAAARACVGAHPSAVASALSRTVRPQSAFARVALHALAATPPLAGTAAAATALIAAAVATDFGVEAEDPPLAAALVEALAALPPSSDAAPSPPHGTIAGNTSDGGATALLLRVASAGSWAAAEAAAALAARASADDGAAFDMLAAVAGAVVDPRRRGAAGLDEHRYFELAAAVAIARIVELWPADSRTLRLLVDASLSGGGNQRAALGALLSGHWSAQPATFDVLRALALNVADPRRPGGSSLQPPVSVIDALAERWRTHPDTRPLLWHVAHNATYSRKHARRALIALAAFWPEHADTLPRLLAIATYADGAGGEARVAAALLATAWHDDPAPFGLMRHLATRGAFGTTIHDIDVGDDIVGALRARFPPNRRRGYSVGGEHAPPGCARGSSRGGGDIECGAATRRREQSVHAVTALACGWRRHENTSRVLAVVARDGNEAAASRALDALAACWPTLPATVPALQAALHAGSDATRCAAARGLVAASVAGDSAATFAVLRAAALGGGPVAPAAVRALRRGAWAPAEEAALPALLLGLATRAEAADARDEQTSCAALSALVHRFPGHPDTWPALWSVVHAHLLGADDAGRGMCLHEERQQGYCYSPVFELDGVVGVRSRHALTLALLVWAEHAHAMALVASVGRAIGALPLRVPAQPAAQRAGAAAGWGRWPAVDAHTPADRNRFRRSRWASAEPRLYVYRQSQRAIPLTAALAAASEAGAAAGLPLAGPRRAPAGSELWALRDQLFSVSGVPWPNCTCHVPKSY